MPGITTTQSPSALYKLLPIAGGSQNQAAGFNDPYNVLSEGDQSYSSEINSPGYQAYGSDWINLISAIQANTAPATFTPTTNKQGDRVYNGAHGGVDPKIAEYQSSLSGDARAADLAQAESSIPYFQAAPNIASNGLSGGPNPLGLQGNLASSILSVINSDPQNSGLIPLLADYAKPVVAQSMGLDPSNPEAQKYSDAYVTYVLQSNNQAQTENALDAKHKEGSFEQIFGKLGEIGAYALAGGAGGIAAGSGAAAGSLGGSIAESTAESGAAAGSTAGSVAASTAADELDIFNTVSSGINSGRAIYTGDPLGAVEGGISGLSNLSGALSTPGSTNGNLNTLTSAASSAPGNGNGMSWLDDIGSFFGGGTGTGQDVSISGAQSPAGGGLTLPSGGASIPQTSGVSLPSVGDGNNISGFGGSASAAGGNSLGNFLSNPSFGGLGNFLSKNANLLVPAAGLGVQALQGNSTPKGMGQIEGQAAQLNSQGQQLEGYLNNGTLPPGVSASLKQAGDSAKAAIKSQYAARGMSGSSAEAQDLANVDAQISSQGTQIATQLLQTGIQETGLSSQLYDQIMKATMQQDEGLGSAITNFASSVAGGGAPAQRPA